MSLYRDILKDRYDILPPAVRELHGDADHRVYHGTAKVRRGTNILSRLFANILALPKAGDNVAVEVDFRRDGAKELWLRSFNGRPYTSKQWQVGNLLYERLNFTTFVFNIAATDKMLDLELQQLYVLGIPQMKFMRPDVIARETEVDGKFHFFIKATLPVIGLLIEYEGDLVKKAPAHAKL